MMAYQGTQVSFGHLGLPDFYKKPKDEQCDKKTAENIFLAVCFFI
jgi:hypothetical protein